MSETKLPLRLPVLPTEVRSPDDRIACRPYHAVLFARVCAERQRVAGIATRQRAADTPKVAGWRGNLLLGDYGNCIGCADGAHVAEALGLPAAPAPPPPPKRIDRQREQEIKEYDPDWRAVPGYGGVYEVNRSGDVRRRPGSFRAPTGLVLQNVRGRVRLMQDRRQVYVLVAALVHEVWGAAAARATS